MKIRKTKWGLLLFVLVFVICNSTSAFAAGTGSFTVGGFWQPPTKPVDYNTNANWANIAAANLDVMVAQRVGGSNTMNKTENETGIQYSFANNVKLQVIDSGIYSRPIYTEADRTAFNSVLMPYVNDPRVQGLALKDEPAPWEMEGIANSYKQIKSVDPSMDVYVNFCNSGPTPGKLVLSNSGARETGSFVTSTNPVGQTFKVPAGVTYIDSIDMYIDSGTWASDEVLTLKVWNSTAKTTLLGQASKTGTGATDEASKYPAFPVHAAVTPGTTYYMELTHNGGGNNNVGWIVRSTTSTYADGTAYENGVAKTYDFCFRVYTSRTNDGTRYENQLDDWITMSGADRLLQDGYPFFGSSDNAEYFPMAEAMRSRGLANDVIYGGFLQSVQILNNGVETYRNPNMNMMRWNAYTLLTYGNKMTYWFTYWRPDNGGGVENFYNSPVDFDGTLLTKYSQIQTLNGEMRKLGNTLKNLTSRRVYHEGSSIPPATTYVPADFFVKSDNILNPVMEGYFTDASGRSYVMITNRDYNMTRDIHFYVNPKPASMTEISKTTGAEVAVTNTSYNPSNGVLYITLQPGEGRLFAMPVGYTPYENLAALAKVTASSSWESTNNGWGINKVNDDIKAPVAKNSDTYRHTSNGWTSQSSLGANHTESITFDLGSDKTVGEVDLYPRSDAGYVGGGFPVNFTIKTSTDNTNWTTVVTKTSYPQPGNVGQFFTFPAQTARYVKIEGTSLRVITGEYRMQLAEVEIYSDANYAKAATISGASSSLETSDFGMAKVHDGTRNSVAGSVGWTSNNTPTVNHTEYITFDMGSGKSISRVDLFPRNQTNYVGNGFPVDFTIQVSNDNVNWTTVISRTGYAQPDQNVQSFSFTAQTARYVKIQGTNLRNNGEYRMQFAEVGIY